MAVYNILIRVYYLILLAASPLHSKARKWIVGRKNLREQFSVIDFSKERWVWFHCSSYGEFQDGRTLMEAYKKEHPQTQILLTFFSSTGYELKRNYQVASAVFYLPLDTAANALWLLDMVKPITVFFIRHDIWPNYILACAKRNIPVFLTSFTLNSESKFFKWPLKEFYRKTFRRLCGIFVHNNDVKQLLQLNGFSDNIVVAGNSRIDAIIEAAAKSKGDELIQRFVSDSFCCIAGSTHKKDVEIFLAAFELLEAQNIKWILVPHEVDASEIKNAKEKLGNKMSLLSEAGHCEPQIKLLWVDRVGALAGLYRYANLAFIGGGFNRSGIHSILEPLIFGSAVCFGPNIRNYQEAKDLLKTGDTKIIESPEELVSFIIQLKADREYLNKLGKENNNYISRAAGATRQIISYLESRNHFV